jgi:glycosyltransferase involved in cell wall biosynthesis
VSKPFVSAVICCYNYGRYVDQAIDSALAQKWPKDRYEVIVVDDGSTDETPEVLARYGDRIRVVRQENAGVIAATSAGFAAARGEFVGTLDADDRWLPTAVPTLVAALRRNPDVGLVMGDLRVVDDSGRVLHPSFRRIAGMISGRARIRGKLLRRCHVNTNGLMFRRAVVEPFLPLKRVCPYQDWWLALELSRVTDFIAVPDIVALYRSHGGNLVLGSDDGPKAAARELPFRRWLLTEAGETAGATAPELFDALLAFDHLCGMLQRSDPERFAALVPMDDDRRHLAGEAMLAASDALDAGLLDEAAAALTHAAAHDLGAIEPRELLNQLASLTMYAPPVAA